MSVIHRILNDLKKEKGVKIRRRYFLKGRLIDYNLYHSLKCKKKCEKCKLNFKMLEIHHIIPISKGGNNEASNLMALCSSCHKIKDKEAIQIPKQLT